jgi:hypothetical protein
MTKDEGLRLALRAMEMFCEHGAILRPIETRDAIKAALEAKDEPVAADGNTSDGYHKFNELYEFRKAYNVALFNEWASSGKCSVHKSWRHNDGELCFGGGWFIVVAVLPQGQISNHYEAKDWELFAVPQTERALFEFDGHAGSDVIERLKDYTTPPQRKPCGLECDCTDVCKQEAKDEPVAHSVVAGALFDFMGWLTSREKRLILSSVDEASPAVEAITEFAKKRNLSLKYAEVGYWMEFLSTPPKQEAKDEPVPVAIVEVFGKDWRLDYMALPVGKHKLYAQQYTYTTPPQQEAKDEPVAWISPTELLVMRGNALGGAKDWRVNVGLKPEDGDVGLYTAPPQRTWVGLTDEDEIDWEEGGNLRDLVKAIEAKLKEKNT